MIELIAGDAQQILETDQIKDQSIDVTWTSPPYKKADGYRFNKMMDIFELLWAKHRWGSRLYMNMGLLVGEGPLNVDYIYGALERKGWKCPGKIYWSHHMDGGGHFSPLPGEHLNNLIEEIVIFDKLKKGQRPHVNRLAIGVRYTDESNVKRRGHKQNLRCGGNWFYEPYPTVQSKAEKTHKDQIPEWVVKKCLMLSDMHNKKGLVFDPFAGGGTTLEVARDLGCRAIGVEIDPEKASKTRLRLESSKGEG